MIRIEVVPCLVDNYAYLVINEGTRKAILVDAPDGEVISRRISELGLELEAVLITHHHDDHINGIEKLNCAQAIIVGHKLDAHRLPKLDLEIEVGQVLEFIGIKVEVMKADGHTLGHLAYYMPEANAVFTGDSLMIWGVGRLFEGRIADMFETLSRLSALPDDTEIFSGHNYGEVGARFALSLDHGHEPSLRRQDKIREQNRLSKPVVPVRLEEEKLTSPYFRIWDESYAEALGIKGKSVLERMAVIRKMRDVF